MDYDTNSYPYSPRNPLASVSWKTPTTEDVLIQIKSSLRRTPPIPVLYVLYHWPRQRRPPHSVSLSPPPSHLARRDVTLKTPCNCDFCVWIQSICLLFSQLPYATWVVARDSCVVLLLVCSHCLKKTQSGWFGDFDPSTGALHSGPMHMCLLMSSSIVVKSIVGYVCVWHGYWTFNFIQDNRTQLQSFRQSCTIDRPFRLSPSYVVVVDVTVVLYT